jgi:hypothetical protein
MVFVHEDKSFLTALVPLVRSFLHDHLSLELHPKKIYLQPVEHGVPFLGVFILPYRTYPGRRVVANFREALRSQAPAQVLESYLGMFGHHDAMRLSHKLSHGSG